MYSKHKAVHTVPVLLCQVNTAENQGWSQILIRGSPSPAGEQIQSGKGICATCPWG